MTMAKKSFKDNPALQFISAVPSAPDPEPVQPIRQEQKLSASAAAQRPKQKTAAAAPRRAALPDRGPAFEAKSKRLNLLIRPSLFESLSKTAHKKGMSNNDLIHQVLERAVQSGSIDNI